MRFTPKLVLPVLLMVEILIYLSIASDSDKHSLIGVFNAGLFVPAILGVMLRWLYQYKAEPVFKTVLAALLLVSCVFYGLYTLFILFIIITPGSSTSSGSNTGLFFSIVTMLLPLVINVCLLYGHKADKKSVNQGTS